MSVDKKLIEIIARAIADADNWQDFIEDAQRTLAAIRDGYLLIPTEGPEWEAALRRATEAFWRGSDWFVDAMTAALRAAGGVE